MLCRALDQRARGVPRASSVSGASSNVPGAIARPCSAGRRPGSGAVSSSASPLCSSCTSLLHNQQRWSGRLAHKSVSHPGELHKMAHLQNRCGQLPTTRKPPHVIQLLPVDAGPLCSTPSGSPPCRAGPFSPAASFSAPPLPPSRRQPPSPPTRSKSSSPRRPPRWQTLSPPP